MWHLSQSSAPTKRSRPDRSWMQSLALGSQTQNLILRSPQFLRDRLTENTFILSITNKATPHLDNHWIPLSLIFMRTRPFDWDSLFSLCKSSLNCSLIVFISIYSFDFAFEKFWKKKFQDLTVYRQCNNMCKSWQVHEN